MLSYSFALYGVECNLVTEEMQNDKLTIGSKKKKKISSFVQIIYIIIHTFKPLLTNVYGSKTLIVDFLDIVSYRNLLSQQAL